MAKLNLNNLNAKAIRMNQFGQNNAGTNVFSSNYSSQVNKDNPGVKPTTQAGRREKCYNNEQEEEDGLEEASRVLTLDDFAPNYHQSAKPVSPAKVNPVNMHQQQHPALRDSSHPNQNH